MLPQSVQNTMNTLCASLEVRTSNIQAVYLYGSIALGDYIEGSSDIDFVAVFKGPPSDSDVQAIIEAHKEVENENPRMDIMGAYLLEYDLGKPQSEISTLLTYYNKQIHTNRTGADINPITWWILKKQGIKVFGSDLSFNYDIDIDYTVKYVIGNLNTYWLNWISRLENQLQSDQEILLEQLDEVVEWCTLGMLRQLYTVKEHDIKSKISAGHYGIQSLPAQWHELIQEAISIKQLRPRRCYASQVERLSDLVALLRFIHSEANRTNKSLH